MAPTRSQPGLRRADAANDGSFFPFPLGKNRRNLPKSKGKSEVKTFKINNLKEISGLAR